MMQNVLKINQLSVDYGSVSAVRNASLDIAQGESIGLLGHNGAGKTTTMRAIMGLLPISKGSIRFLDNEFGALRTDLRVQKGIGYSPEDRRMIGGMSVEDNLCLPTLACQMNAATRSERLERVFHLVPELKDLRKRLSGSLSGGQQRMVALGRALVVGSKLLLLDEPFQGLAPVLARRYAETLSRLREQDAGVAILISEINQSLIRDLVQRTYTINRGEIVDVSVA